jgi:hypothetical protein
VRFSSNLCMTALPSMRLSLLRRLTLPILREIFWSAATVLGDSLPGNKDRLVPGYTAVALLGARRAAPPATR